MTGQTSLVVPAGLRAELETAAREEDRTAEDIMRELIEQGLERRRLRVSILARVDRAKVSLGRGEGLPITDDDMQRLAAGIKQRGRARLARKAGLDSTK